MLQMIKILSLSVIIAMLVGCGQTGPLYLPGHPPPGYPIKEIQKERQLQQHSHVYVGMSGGVAN
jgi:predicted small lipoprotein YifL